MKKTLRVILFCFAIVTFAWFLGTFFGKLSKTDSCAEALRLTFSLESLAKVVIPIVILAAVYIAIILQIVFHEVGHLVFGLLTGYRFLSFSAFGMILIRDDDGLKLKRFSMPGTGGQCLMIPPEGEGNKVPVVAYNAGGIVFNLSLSAIALVLILLFHPSSLFIVAFLVGIILIGVFIVLVNGIPMHVSGMPNDGYNVLKLRRNPASRQAFAKVLRLNALGVQGLRLRDIPGECFQIITTEDGSIDYSEPMQVNLLMMYITHLIDVGEMDRARNYLQQILESNTKVSIFKLLAKCELFSICMIQGEKTDCDKDLNKQDQATLKALEVSNSSIKRYRFLKALIEEEDLPKAESIYKDVMENKDKFLVKCEWEMDTEIMEQILQEYKSGLYPKDA